MVEKEQIDLFDQDHEMLGHLLDKLDDIPDDEIIGKWPQILADLVDVLACELIRQGKEKAQARKIAAKLAGAIGHYLGGKTTYIPSGSTLKDALRDYVIYTEFTGNNINELCKKYHLSDSHIYAIIRRQRTLFRRRYQPELPL